MPEQKLKITQKRDTFTPGFFIELSCCMCNHEQIIAASTKKDLEKSIKDEGWKTLNSDEYALIGHWCGCDYRD